MNRMYSTSLASFALLSAALQGCDSQGSSPQQIETARSSVVRATDPSVSAADAATLATMPIG